MAFWAALNASQFINTCHLADAFHLDVIFEHPAICANKHKTSKHFLKGTVHSKIVIIYSPSFSKPVWLLLIFNCSKNEWGLEFSSLKKGMQKRYKTFIKIVHMTCYLINICSLYTRLVNKSFFGVASVQLICLVHKSFTDSFTDSVLEFNSLNQWLSCGSSWAELTGGEDYRWIIFILGVNYSFKSLTQLPIAGLYPFSSIWIRVKQSSVQVCSWFSPHSTTTLGLVLLYQTYVKNRWKCFQLCMWVLWWGNVSATATTQLMQKPISFWHRKDDLLFVAVSQIFIPL